MEDTKFFVDGGRWTDGAWCVTARGGMERREREEGLSVKWATQVK